MSPPSNDAPASRARKAAARGADGAAQAPGLRALATLAFSLVVFALSLGAAMLSTNRGGLYADPGRAEAAAPLKVGAGR